MISKLAVQRFLSRELASFNWIKQFSREALEAEFNNLTPKPRFTGPYRPYKHQLAGFLIGLHFPEFLYFLDLATGKTRIPLDLIAYAKLRGEKPRVLALVPNVANIENWVMEIETHTPTLSYVPLFGSSEERLQLLRRKADLFIINYAGFAALCSTLQAKESKKRKRKVDEDKLTQVIQGFTGMVLDESTSIQNHSSLTYKVCNQCAKIARRRYALTGTPMGRDPQALWTQFYFIDRGKTLGPTLGLFREAFFTKKRRYWGGFDFTLKPEREKLLHRTLQNRSIYYNESECIALPLKVYARRHVTFTSDMEAYYSRIKGQLIEARGNYHLVKNAFLQMRQISSGFLGVVDNETGERAQLEFPENPKLDELLEIISEMPSKAKFVVFHEYIWSGAKMSGALSKLGIKHERLWSGQKDPAGALRRFREQPNCRGLLANNQSGAFGLNLQVANYAIFYESPTSPLIRTQAEKRIRRPGQKAARCFYIDLIMKGTYDERILDYLAEGKDLFDAVVAGKERVKHAA